MREVRRFREFKRLIGRPVVPGKVGVLWSQLGRAMALWRWRRETRYLELIRETMRKIDRVRKEEREARAIFARKIVRPYWRIDVAYQFQETRHAPPYHFYAEFRKYVYTQRPEKYADWDEKTQQFKIKPDVLSHFEGELRLIMFASSVMVRKRRDGSIAHGVWVEELLKRKKLPFPNVEIEAVDETEVEHPLDGEHYYVRFEEEVPEPPKGEYGDREVASWLRIYKAWLSEMHRRGIIRRPDLLEKTIKQTSLEKFVSEKFHKEGGEETRGSP